MINNIGLYLVTLTIYFIVSFAVLYDRTDNMEGEGLFNFKNPEKVKRDAKRLFISLAFLCLPVNINGNIFTVFGNAVSEKSVYSVWSFYQEAKEDAGSIFGLTAYQKAGRDALIAFGLVGYQKAEKNDALIMAGFPIYQKAGNVSLVLFGGAGFQNAKYANLGFGLFIYQKATETSELGFGLVGYQNAGKRAVTKFSMALYQKVGVLDRSFAVWSKLEVPPNKNTK